MGSRKKDRRHEIVLGDGSRADILYLRTSSHPAEYALILRRIEGSERVAVICADNSHLDHHVDGHHLHRYREDRKGPPEPLPFPVTDANDAMHKIIDWMADNWEELIR